MAAVIVSKDLRELLIQFNEVWHYILHQMKWYTSQHLVVDFINHFLKNSIPRHKIESITSNKTKILQKFFFFSSFRFTDNTGQQKNNVEVVLKHQTSFLANLRALNQKIILLFLGELPFLLHRNASFLEKKDIFHLFSEYMIWTSGNISQSKIIETSQFIFKSTNIGLHIEKYYFFNNNLTLSL